MSKNFAAAEVARQFVQQTPVIWWREDSYLYQNGVYVKGSKDWLLSEIQKFVEAHWGRDYDAGDIRSAAQLVRSATYLKEDIVLPMLLSTRQRVDAIVCKNGTITIDRDGVATFGPHSPDLFVVNGVDYDYDSAATCPEWLGFLRWMCSGDDGEVRLIAQFAAWAFVAYRLKLEKVLWLCGWGCNGKSTCFSVLRHVLGKQSTAAIGLRAFAGEGSDFRLWKVLDRIANFAPDVDVRRHQPVATINAFVSGDAFTFERKYREAVTAEPAMALFFGSNALPIFPDVSDAWWRRLLLVRCRQKPTVEDAALRDRLLAEAPGILNWVLAELPGLIDRKKFDIPASVLANVAFCKSQVNSARLFLGQKVEKREGEFQDGRQLMGIYQEWCKSNGYKEVDLGVMKEEVLRSYGVEYGRHRVRMDAGRAKLCSDDGRCQRPYGWVSIKVLNDDQLDERRGGVVVLSEDRAQQIEVEKQQLQVRLDKLEQERKREVDELQRRLAEQEAELNGLRPPSNIGAEMDRLIALQDVNDVGPDFDAERREEQKRLDEQNLQEDQKRLEDQKVLLERKAVQKVEDLKRQLTKREAELERLRADQEEAA